MGLCVQLVCACTSNIIMYFQFYFRLFSENDGLDCLRQGPNGVGFMIREQPLVMIGLNNGYCLSEISESAGLLGQLYKQTSLRHF